MKITHKILGLLLTSLFVLSSCTEKQNSEKPKQAISYEKAKTLQQEYINTRVKPTIAAFDSIGIRKKEDVRDVTFDLESIKQYIAYVEKEAAKQNINDGLSLRVYLGAYKDGDVTMFFMPTQKIEKIKNVNNFFYFPPQSRILNGVDGMNIGLGGNPPNSNNLQ